MLTNQPQTCNDFGTCAHAGHTYTLAEQAVPDSDTSYHAVAYDTSSHERVVVSWIDTIDTQKITSVQNY